MTHLGMCDPLGVVVPNLSRGQERGELQGDEAAGPSMYKTEPHHPPTHISKSPVVSLLVQVKIPGAPLPLQVISKSCWLYPGVPQIQVLTALTCTSKTLYTSCYILGFF